MKKIMLIGFICIGIFVRSDAQAIFIIRLISSKIIKAIDLRVQQLQNEAIKLQLLQKKIENNLSLNSLNEITAWQQKQKELYAGYFDELGKVKNAITFTSRISETIEKQKQLVIDTRKSMQLIYADSHFSLNEAERFHSLCENLLTDCASTLSRILQMVSTGQFTMTDGERLSALIQISDQIESQEAELKYCLQKVRDLAVSREQNATQIISIKKLYGFR